MGTGGLLGAKQLDRNLAIEAQIPRAEYLGGTIASDRRDELVMRDPPAGRRGGGAVSRHGGASRVDDERRAVAGGAEGGGPETGFSRAPGLHRVAELERGG